jgi:hypothetical protein
MFPISASQIDLQVEVSVHPEPPFGELPTKPLDIEREPPEFAFSPDAAIDPKPPAKPPDANEASDALEFETILFAVAIERKPPEFTLWTFSPDLAVEPEPRAKPPDDAPELMPPPEPPDPDTGAPSLVHFPHGGDHGIIISKVPSNIRPLFVDPSESKQTDRPDTIDEPMPVTERPPLKLSAAAETAETFSAINPNSHQALMFPISAYQTKYQVEFSSRSEPLFDAPPIKPPVFTLWTMPNKPPQFEWLTISTDAAVEPKPRAKPPDANVAFELELWTIPFAIAIERKPPEFTLWTFPSDLATKPRAKPPNDAPKPMPPPEPPDSDSSIGVPFAAYFPHGGDHGTIFPGA